MTDKTQNPPLPTEIFADIFGATWSNLPPVMRDHYAIRAHTKDLVIATGKMTITMSAVAKLMGPFLKFTGTLVPRASDNVAVTVRFTSDENRWMCFDRLFKFPDGQQERFFSRMQPTKDNQVIEWTGSGIGWRAAFSFENDKVILAHQGYSLRIFGRVFNLPVSWLFGSGNASEQATSNTGFDMEMTLSHPLFGMMYGYNGHFEITEVSLDE